MIRGVQLEPSRARWGGTLLVLVQCATLALLEEGHRFGIAMGIVALGSHWSRLRFPPERSPHWIWLALLAVALAVKHRVAPETLNEQITFFNTVVAYEAARYLIFLQVVELYVDRPAGRLPVWFGAIAALNMVFVSNVRLNPATQTLAMGLSLAYVTALAMFAAFRRRRLSEYASRRGQALAGGVLALVLVGGIVTAEVLRRYESQLERWLAGGRLGGESGASEVGFSGRGDIGNIARMQQQLPARIALRVHADGAPGYLRGKVFDEFHGALWTDNVELRPAIELQAASKLLAQSQESLYALYAGAFPELVHPTLEVWPNGVHEDRLFHPLDAALIGTAPSRISTSPNEQAERRGVDPAAPYSLWLDREPRRRELDPIGRARWLAVDDYQTSRLRPFADAVFTGCRTPAEKLAAVRRYFQTNFRYALQAQPNHGDDLLAEFLTSRRPAHCEYFASAAAVLLRLANVPTRYVTGYVATEWNSAGEYWVARQRDAHAWVEAYDEVAGVWRTVECTPAGGIPAHETAGRWSDWWDARWQRMREWLHRALSGGAAHFLASLAALVIRPPVMATLILGLGAVWVWTRRRRFRVAAVVSAEDSHPLLQRSLKQAERLARRMGVRRRDTETLSQVAVRLRQAPSGHQPGASTLADWYDEYVRVRYGEVSGQARAELSSQLRSVSATLRGSRLLLRRFR